MGEHEKLLLVWLEAHGPDEWHQVAIDWNWDAGVEILAWIAAQPGCDRATAQYFIAQGGADYLIACPDRNALVVQRPHAAEAFDFLVPVIQRWNAGFYTRSMIASYAPDSLACWARDYRAAEAEQVKNGLPWRLDASVFAPIDGRRFSYRFAEGWPPEVEADLKARKIPY